jgi:glycosyltransferase 2 family protein
VKRAFWVRALFSIIALLFLFVKIDLQKVSVLLLSIKHSTFIFFLIPFIVSGVLNSVSIFFLLGSLKIKVKLEEIIKLKFISRSFSLFFPGQLGELSLAPLLKTRGVPMGLALATITVDKIISLIVLGIFASCGLLVFVGSLIAIKLLVFLGVGVIVAILALSSHTLRKFCRNFILRKYAKLFKGFYKFLTILACQKTALLVNVLLTVSWLLVTSIVIKYLLAYFGFNIPVLIIMAIQSIGSISSIVPISLAGLGIRESIIVFLYEKVGVDPAAIGSILLVFLFVSYLISVLVIIAVSKDFNVGTLKGIIQHESSN